MTSSDIKLENLYKELFEKYLINKIDLIKYDNEINSSSLGFTESNNVSLASNLDEYLNLKYFYILNRFYLDKLSDEDLNILINGNDLERLLLIENTYKKVLIYGNDINLKLNHNNNDILNDFSNNGELVFGLYYGSSSLKVINEDEYFDNYNKKKEFLNDLADRLKNKIYDKLDLSVKIIIRKK